MSTASPPISAPALATSEAAFIEDAATPRWIKDVFRFLAVKSQFVLSGNTRDRYAFPAGGGKYVPLTLKQYLAEALRLKGYTRFASFRSTTGFSVVVPRGEPEAAAREFFKDAAQLNFDGAGCFRCSLEESLKKLEQIVACKEIKLF